jgi:norsolorinic acid ketoreductase
VRGLVHIGFCAIADWRSFMQTDMGNTGARHFGYEQAFVPVAASVKFIIEQLEGATRDTVGGKFVTIDEERKEVEW